MKKIGTVCCVAFIASSLCGAQLKKTVYASSGTMPIMSNSIKHSIRTLKAGAKTSFESLVEINDAVYIVGQGVDADGFFGFLLTRYVVQKDGTYDVDTTFGSDGVVITKIGREAKAFRVITDTRNGSTFLIVVGYGTDSVGKRCMAAACYTIDGKLENSFANKGIVSASIARWSEAYGIAITQDGTIFMAGVSSQVPQDTTKMVATVVCCDAHGKVNQAWADKGILLLSEPATKYCDEKGETIVFNAGSTPPSVSVVTSAGQSSSACGVVLWGNFLYVAGQGTGGQNAVNLQSVGGAKSKTRIGPFVACYRISDAALNNDFKNYHFGVAGEAAGGIIFPNIGNDSVSGFTHFVGNTEAIGFELYGIGYVFSTNFSTSVNAARGSQVRSVLVRMDSKGILKTGLGQVAGPLFNNGVIQTYLVDPGSTAASNPSKFYGTGFTYYMFKNTVTDTAMTNGILIAGYGMFARDNRNHIVLTRYVVNFSSKDWDLDLKEFGFDSLVGLAGKYNGHALIYAGNNDWDIYGKAVCAPKGIIFVAGTAEKGKESCGIVALYDGMHGMPLLR